MRYYVIGPGGTKHGPADLALLNQWIVEGRIIESTQLEAETTGQRRAALVMPGLLFNQAPGPATPTADPYLQPYPLIPPTSSAGTNPFSGRVGQPGPGANPAGNPYSSAGPRPVQNPYATPGQPGPSPYLGGSMPPGQSPGIPQNPQLSPSPYPRGSGRAYSPAGNGQSELNTAKWLAILAIPMQCCCGHLGFAFGIGAIVLGVMATKKGVTGAGVWIALGAISVLAGILFQLFAGSIWNYLPRT